MPRLTTRIRYGLARMLLKARSFSIVPPWVTTSVLNPSYRNLVRDGYAKSSAYFACISALAFAFPEPPLAIYDGDGDDAQQLPAHGLRKLLRRPMPTMGEAELMATTMVYLAIGGNAYWHKRRGAAGQVVQLCPYGAGHIIPIPGGENWITGYSYDPYGAGGAGTALAGVDPEPIPPDDIVHFKWPSVDPTQPWMSQPPILAAAAEVDSDVEMVRFLRALLKNDAVPRTVLTVPGDRMLTDEEYERTKVQWKERHGGDERGSVAILEGGATAQRLGLNMQELAFDAMANIPESRIAAAMRVPPIVAGLNVGLARATYSNYGEARAAFTQDTLVPLWRLIASEVEADLLMGEKQWRSERGVTARYDLRRVAALQEDANGKWKRTTDAYKAGLLTKNEGRRTLGYADDPAGDTYYSIPAKPAAALPAAEQPSKTALLLADGRILALPAPVPAQTKVVADKDETAARRGVQTYLSGQYTTAADAVRGRDGLPDEETVEQLGLDMGEEAGRTMRRYYPRAIRSAFQDAEAALDLDLAFDVANPRVQDVLDELVTQVARISETTRNEIRSLIGRAAVDGWSVEQLAEAIVTHGATASLTRATTIARTEMAAAYSRGSILAYQESGVVKQVEWLATLDKNTCADCRALHGTAAKLGKAFADGTEMPPRHPNCRCSLAPRID